MTKEKIENLPADREIDALIAVEFFEWRWLALEINGKKFTACFPPDDVYNISSDIYEVSDDKAERSSDWDKIGWEDVDGELKIGFPYYSTDIKAAFKIIDKVSSQSHTYHLAWYGGERGVCANFTGQISGERYASLSEYGTFEKAQCLAICRAALLWKYGEDKKVNPDSHHSDQASSDQPRKGYNESRNPAR